MNVILPIAIYAALGLVGLGIVGMGISGLRSLIYGKVKMISIVIVTIPGILVVVLGAAMETWAEAGIFTLVAMFALTMVGMLFAGIRSLFV